MRHISLPRGISHLGHKHQTSAPGNDGAQRPSPPKRAGSASSTNALSLEQKPLILKVYVIKVEKLVARCVTSNTNATQGTKSGRQRQVWHIRSCKFDTAAKLSFLTLPVPCRYPWKCETVDSFNQQDSESRVEDMLRHATYRGAVARVYVLG